MESLPVSPPIASSSRRRRIRRVGQRRRRSTPLRMRSLRLGEVIRLEATTIFRSGSARARPDIVFNIAEGLHGANREAHVPAICEFFGIPYSGSDPFTLSLCLDKARTKETLSRSRNPDCALRRRRASWPIIELATAELALPALRQAHPRRIVEGNHRAEFLPDGRRARGQVKFLLETLRPAGDRRRVSARRRVHLRASSATATTREVLPIVGMNFDVAARGRASDLRLRSEVDLGSPRASARHFRVPRRYHATRFTRAIERVTLDAYRVLGCRDWSRIDVRLDAAGRAERRRSESASRNSSGSGGQLVPSESSARGGDRLRRRSFRTCLKYCRRRGRECDLESSDCASDRSSERLLVTSDGVTGCGGTRMKIGVVVRWDVRTWTATRWTHPRVGRGGRERDRRVERTTSLFACP